MRAFTVIAERISVNSARTLIVVAMPATVMALITRVQIANEDSEATEQLAVSINRLSAAGAGTGTGYTPEAMEVQDQGAHDGTYTVNFTAEPTTYNTNPLWRDGFNIVPGLTWVPALEDRIWIPPSAKVGLRLRTAPAAALNLTASMTVLEVG